MDVSNLLDPESVAFEPKFDSAFEQARPHFYIGQHDSDRYDALTEDEYDRVLDVGFNFVTVPITNQHFRSRVTRLREEHTAALAALDLTPVERANPSLPGLTVSTLTDEDTTLFPGGYISTSVAYSSPWIDLCSEDPLVANISRQVLNLEVAYANFCGVRSMIIPGPRQDGKGKQVAQFGRAILEAFQVAGRVNLIIHLPMYREPGLEEKAKTLSDFGSSAEEKEKEKDDEIDLFSSWDSWHTIRTICNYNMRLFVAVRVPSKLPDIELQTRWFAEPLHYLTFSPDTFRENRAGYPCLSKYHQTMINMYMRLKNAPWILLCDAGPGAQELQNPTAVSNGDFPTLVESHGAASSQTEKRRYQKINDYVAYLGNLERKQEPLTDLEKTTLTSFQDWLQSPLQPLSDNLESSTYEMFEGDPVKYDLYEQAITEAMAEWIELKKPTSSLPASGTSSAHGPELIVAVAGAGRGPLVTRALRASEKTGMPIQLWALEKNQNAYVYLLRQNKLAWGGKVHVVKTDMREWEGPVPAGYEGAGVRTTVDILVTELLGSFGDNELSPECLDGIQKHIARPHGISIPHSYTAHLSPISYPRVHAELGGRLTTDPSAFETPWVVRLYAIDFVAQRRVPGHARFQQAWEFVHPVRLPFVEAWEEDHGPKRVQTGGGGAMHLSAGLNEHNARHCHLTFVCRSRGVVHGLAGYFESVLYKSQMQDQAKEPVELSTLPEEIDKKSKDMISWFPIFFPLKQPLYFPQDAELEVSMWRQTDDTKVWYEWIVEAYAWVSAKTRVKVGASDLHSSRKVACLM